MLSDKMEKALNKQLNEELYSSYVYLAMAAWFESKNLKGMANWMQIQTQEENQHAMKFFNFIMDRGGEVTLESIEKPAREFKSPLEVFEKAYAHECHITSCINKLVDQAVKDSDHATNAFLQWFVSEQVEEEANTDDIIQKLKLVDKHPHGIFMIDQELGKRSLAPAGAE